MIRERVDLHGKVRSMEPKEDIAALQLRPSEIGIIKEEALLKWLAGQEEWDRRFKDCAMKIIKKRKFYEMKADSMIKSAISSIRESDDLAGRPTVERSSSAVRGTLPRRVIQEDRRWGPLDLADERPPPTAIAARRDTVSGQLKCTLTHV